MQQKKQFRTNFDIQSQLEIIKNKITSGCPKHKGEMLMFLCQTCDQLICPLCLGEEKHLQYCQFSTVKEAAQLIRAEFESEREDVNKKFINDQALLSQHKRHLTQLEKIKCDAADMIKCIDSCKTEIKDFIHEVEQKEQTSKGIINDIQEYQDKNERLIQLMSGTDDVHILLEKENVSALLDDLNWETAYTSAPTTEPSEDHLTQIFECFSCNVQGMIKKIQQEHEESSSTASSFTSTATPTKQHEQSDLDDVSPFEKQSRQKLGETLYPKVVSVLEQIFGSKNIPGKVTGMMLELDPIQIQYMITYSDMLASKVEESIEVLIAAHNTHKQPKSGFQTEKIPLQNATKPAKPSTDDDPTQYKHSRQELGEQLYPKIFSVLAQLLNVGTTDIPGKVTGMMLELEEAEIQDVLSNSCMLTTKVEDATEILINHLTDKLQKHRTGAGVT
ncbi:uncharacterized protein [Amphiura filiformis]|uniref:uncharacterized protein n=1 Tax=Amphiura filiformis TaxID=82378 RepID=UPI003B228921